MNILLIIFITIFLAEIGDKTMFLVLSFSTKMSLFQVITGLTIGTFVAMSIPVFAGKLIFNFVPENYIHITSSLLFILIGLWFLYSAIKGEDDDDDDINENKLTKKFPGWLATAIIIIILEIGDKTELITFGFSSEKINSFLILTSASLGMIFANLSVLIIKPLIDKIEEKYLDIISALIFLSLGIYGLVK